MQSTSSTPFSHFECRRIYPPLLKRIAFAALGVVAVLFRAVSAPFRRAVKSNAVVIFEPYGMGDALLLQPLVKAHLAAGHMVTMVAKPAWEALFEKHEHLQFVGIAPDYAKAEGSGHTQRHLIWDIAKIGRLLRKHCKGATGIDPRGDVRSILILYVAGCHSVHTLARYFAANDCVVAPLSAHRHPIARNATRRILSQTFAPQCVDYPHTDVSFLLDRGITAPNIELGIIPLTPWQGKMWPKEHWKRFINLTREKGLTPTILCGPGETQKTLEAVGACSDEMPVLESLSVAQWVQSIAHCHTIISVNTGPMHIADALGIRLIVIDGPSRLPLWAPENPNATILHHQETCPWAPVHQSGNGSRSMNDCMGKVTPDEVYHAYQRDA